VTRVVGVGLLTGWGVGAAALPADARVAAAGRRVIPLAPPPLDGERFRRATRECLLGVAAVEAMLADAGLPADAIRGPHTALVYATAAAYGSSNRRFIDYSRTTRAERPTTDTVVAGTARPARAAGGLSQTGGGSGSATQTQGGSASGLYFPYTAPSAVPAEVAIEYRLTGGYVILVGGATAGVEALWQAATLLRAGRCERAVVLTVETFAECEDLWARGRWAVRGPLVEAAACALLEGDGDVRYAAATVPAPLETLAGRRAGETLACGPLIGLALARDAGDEQASLTGQWRGRRMGVTLALATAGAQA
jgi:3-oxoacyl-(acyl-carrier-protein) synthase